MYKYKEVTGLLKGHKFTEAQQKLADYSLDISEDNHQILREFLFFEPIKKSDPDRSYEVLNFICKAGDYDTRFPQIALKIHTVTGNKERVKDLIENKNKNGKKVDLQSTEITYRNFIADLMGIDSPNMIHFLAPIISKLHPKDKPSMRDALKRACELNLLETLKAIFRYKKTFAVNDEDMRECAYHAIVRNNMTIFKLTCQNTSEDALQKWKTHFENMHKIALIDPIKKKYDQEIAIVSNILHEYSIREKLKKKDYEIWDIEA